MTKKISILGSTGSVGVSTLQVLAAMPQPFEVVLLAASRSWEALLRQALSFHPKAVAIGTEAEAHYLRAHLQSHSIRVFVGEQGLLQAIEAFPADLTLSAIVGAAGLKPTLAAIHGGSDIGLANKESMVAAGPFMNRAAEQHGVTIIPVDSEHNAIHQCLRGEHHHEVKRLILTASGGPFRTYQGDFSKITPQQALKHPTWSMGPKITIDSATMMNKGLEVIEAHHLFGFSGSQIEIVVHPQSLVHSMIETVDGSYKCQLSKTDMRDPIQYALTYPERHRAPFETLDITQGLELRFFPVDPQRFPCIHLAYRALEMGGGAPTVLNAANEVAVSAFLEHKISFSAIPRLNASCLDQLGHLEPDGLDAIFEIDQQSRSIAEAWVQEQH